MNLNKRIQRSIEKKMKADSAVHAVGAWVGKELKLTLANLDVAYISFEVSDDSKRIRLKTTFWDCAYNGQVFAI